MEESCDNRPKDFKALIKSGYFWRPVSGIIVGGIVGFLYYFYVGCASGSCAITSHPVSSILFGSVLGLFVVNRPCKTC